ncbi:uncharacterized protein [Littorina saxatilis]|uniref:uncharacterized protein isoform X3 n=1 Tax=Littorina saxatilis TaxID=31220 RepID=UPI0038B52C0D
MGILGAWVCVLMGLLVGQGQGYYFPPGYALHYTYTAVNTMMDHRDVTSILKFHVNFLGEDDTGERIHSLHVDSFVQFAKGGQLMANPQKWNLTRNFVFKSNSTGAITLVHVHPNDHKELLVLKKALVSVFSVHVQVDDQQDSWQYNTEERDHLGLLQHSYNAKRTQNGMKLTRQHSSEDKVHRSHDKTMHYDRKGTLQSAVARDQVTIKNGVDDVKSKPDTNDQGHGTSSGEYPVIEAKAQVRVTYTGRKRVKPGNFQTQKEYIAKMKVDSLETQHNETTQKPLGLEEVRQNMTEIWTCIHYHVEAHSENRTACVNDLRKLLSRLYAAEYEKYAVHMLSRNCSEKQQVCQEDRWIVVDVVAGMGDVISQRLIVTHVLKGRTSPSEEDLRRVFVHCAALEHPTVEFVRAVETYCFGAEGEHHGGRTLARTQGRACLAAGSLVKHLSSSGQDQHAHRLADRLESWLDHHAKGDKRLHKRDTGEALYEIDDDDEDDLSDDSEHMGKAVLLMSLGNGAMLRSRDHLLRHAQPNTGHHIWRRAALRALAQFPCEESARALMVSVTKDSVTSVRRVAWHGFVTHPHRDTLVKGEENDILSANYTYTSVARVKRDLLDIFNKVLFQFKVATPSFEWNYNIGTSQIGGNLGAKFHNSIEGMFRILSGYVDVDINDKLHASVHALSSKIKAELIHVEACYRGRLTYNMNIIKEFTVDLYQDINSVFDHIILRVMEPIEQLASKMSSEFKDGSTQKPKSAIQDLADAVKEMPQQAEKAKTAAKDLSEAADRLGILPSVQKMQDLVSRAKVFLEDVHSEAVELFSNVDDETLVALPFAEKEIKGAINGVLGVLNKVKDYPNQAFAVIETSKMKYLLAMMRITEAGKRVKQAFSFLTGGKSAWNNGREELKNIREQILNLQQKISGDVQRRKKRQAATTFSPCAKVELDGALVTLYNKTGTFVDEVDVVLNHSPAELQKAMDLMTTQVQTMKATFGAFREAIDIVKSRIQALFGTRFHQSFPSIRRDCDETCGCGHYPTDCNRYGHPGVDLVWNEGWKVPSPVTGMVYVEATNTTLRIKPHTDDLKDYEIFISNIELHGNYSGKKEFAVAAGQVLGFSLGNNGCNKGHIHVAMRRTSNKTGLCHYVSPTTFLENSQPKIRWQQECNEFTFRHIFQTVDFADLTKGFKDYLKELKRYALDSLKDYAKEKLVELIPDDSFLRPLRDIGMNLVDNGTLNFDPLEEVFTNGQKSVKDFMDNISKSKFSFKKLVDLAANKTKAFLKPRLDEIVGVIKNITQIPKTFKGIDKLSIGGLSRLWKKITNNSISLPKLDFDGDSPLSILGNLGNALIGELQGFVDNTTFGDLGNLTRLLDRFSGGRESLISKLKQTIRERACPEIGKFLKKQGSPCVPHDDCWGLACVIDVQKQHVKGKVNVDVTVIKTNATTGQPGGVRITVDGKEYSANGDVQDQVIPTNIKVFDSFDVKLRVTSFWTAETLRFSLKLQACGPNMCCLPDVILAKNLTFSNFGISSLLENINLSELVNDIKLLPLDTSHKVTTDLDVESPELTNTILGLEDLIREELGDYLPEDTDFKFYTEFQNPEDYADKGSYPVAGQRTEIYLQFFEYSLPIPLGIATLRLRVSAGGAIGLAFNVEVKSTDSLMKAVVTPWASCKAEAGVSVSIFIVAFGVDLQAWLMKTRFPLTVISNYTKQPVVLTKRIDLELIPLEFKLVAWFEIKIKIGIGWFSFTLFRKRWSKTVWSWRASGVRGTVWEKTEEKNALGPPRFPYCTKVAELCSAAGRRRRAVGNDGPAQCLVKQLPGRHPKDAAFSLDFSVEDELSDLTISYAVGDYPGGTNVLPWTPMRGNTLTVTDKLPCGKPLYFLVRAVNSGGLETVAECSLSTFDCSFPDGRVDMASKCTSHRDKLSATVVVYEDSELKMDELFHSLGFGPGSQGHEVVGWTPLVLQSTHSRDGVEGPLQHFTAAREGRLDFSPETALKTDNVEECAGECLKLYQCVAFSYNAVTYICELQPVVEGVAAQRVKDGHFFTYEKLGKGYSAQVTFTDLPLRHGVRYYVNSQVQNVLDYRSVLTSRGTTVDHTPPEPGYLGEGAVEVPETADRCSVSIIQRCVDPASILTHRKFIDGRGGTTVLNGKKRGHELRFTMDNTHASANWDGFKDSECGIRGYTWAVGTTACGSDVSGFMDPHTTLSDPLDWPNVGIAKGLELEDGSYYVTVKAVSDIKLGGDLVTTVCHSTPFFVDTSPPVIESVDDVIFDDGFRLLAVYFKVDDALSGVAKLEFGLGRTRHDVMIRGYRPFEIRGKAGSTFLLDEEFQTGSGVAAWIRLKVTDNVGLTATGSGNVPILLDSSPPVAGEVLDGDKLGHNTCCTANATALCVQWRDFEDPQSHIHSYLWGVGRTPGADNVVSFTRLSRTDRHTCVTDLTLVHNVRYFSTIVAFNNALNQKSVNVSSDGVLVDLTPPIAGRVVDGDDINNDVDYTSEAASIAAAWEGFSDPETGIDSYTLSVFVNDVLKHTDSDIHDEQFVDHSLSLKHGDTAHVEVTSFNKAGSDVKVTSDGQTVDHTPPELIRIGTAHMSAFQNDATSLDFVWEFRDSESWVKEHRYSVYQRLRGAETLFWPKGADHQVIRVDPAAENSTEDLQLQSLSLVNGASYVLQVTAVNRAKMSATARSQRVTIDTTPPVVEKIRISPPGSPEEVNEEGEVEHIEGEPLTVSWKAHDYESGLANVQLCVGLLNSDCLTSSGKVLSLDENDLHSSTAVLDETDLQVSTEDSKVVYEVLLVTVNGAGLRSPVARSRPIVVLRGNVAGEVLDGTTGEDQDLTNDNSGVSLLFSNFSSEACGIESYEWGVGSSPCETDVLPFSDFGLVVDPDVEGSGSAHAEVTLEEGKTYYTVVRARTGHACHEPYIVSCSDGITIDTTPPRLSFFRSSSSSPSSSMLNVQPLTSQDVVYQTVDDRLEVGWSAEDLVGVNGSRLTLHPLNPAARPLDVPTVSSQPWSVQLASASGESVLSTLWVVDNAGNEAEAFLPTVMLDITRPALEGLQCTEVVSAKSSLVTCSWQTVAEPHSALNTIEFGLGSGPAFPDLLDLTAVHLNDYRWHFDSRVILVDGFEELFDFYVIARVTNAAGLEETTSALVRRDVTPPSVSNIIVVTSPVPGVSRAQQRCQPTRDFIEIDLIDARDDESGILSVEIALGTSRGTSDIHAFLPYTMVDGVYAKGGLDLTPGSTVYVTAKVTNDVGLYTVVMSESVAVSSDPWLEVHDGPGPHDADGQADRNIIQGHWRFADPCPILSAEWSVTELGSGRVIMPFTTLPDSRRRFYDDTVSLVNTKTYVSHVRITDALNRTFTAFSDGVTVSAGIPTTASVWEGFADGMDVDFQQSLNEIDASWDDFGDSRSALPSERVVRYEVALGTDPLRQDTQTNVHRFVDVGLSNTHTFTGLNLQAKNVTYYVTVRAHSLAGTFSEGYSDGVKAGYSDDITPGRVDVDPYQSDTTRIRVAWEGFESDMGNMRYHVGVSSGEPDWGNSSRDCEEFLTSQSVLDVKELQVADSPDAFSVEGLSLRHNDTYFVTLLAEDLLSRCSAVVSLPILVDTTRPVTGTLAMDGYDSGPAVYLQSTETVAVDLGTFADPESSIAVVRVDLIQSDNCGNPDTQEGVVIDTVTAENELRVTLRGLDLQEGVAYVLRATVFNGAGLETNASTKPLLLALSQPSPGTVKLGDSWTGEESLFQSQQDQVHGTIAILPVGSDTACDTERSLVSAENEQAWTALTGSFSQNKSVVENSQILLTVQHSARLISLEKAAVKHSNLTLTEGMYSFRLTPATGVNILTGLTMGSPNWLPPFHAINEALTKDGNIGGCQINVDMCDQNTTMEELPSGDGYGFGISVLEIESTTKLMFWVQDNSKLKRSIIPLDSDPVSTNTQYTFQLTRSAKGFWQIDLLVDGQSKSTVDGFAFPTEFTLSFYTWNMDGYFPPVTDPFNPFHTVAKLTSAMVPLPDRPLCAYGAAFHDSKSGVYEVWAGVSNSMSAAGNVSPFRLVKRFCLPCLTECSSICSVSCINDSVIEDFLVLPFALNNLSLEAWKDAVNGSLPAQSLSTDDASENANSSNGSSFTTSSPEDFNGSDDVSNSTAVELNAFRLPMYYVDVKIVTHSGKTTLSKSPALTVDTSPPSVDRLVTTDPSYSDQEPSEFIGTNETVGMQWAVSEGVSDVVAQWVSLGSEPGADDVLALLEIGRAATSHVLKNLSHLLQDETTYFANLRVTNAAGLSTTSNVSFTVSTGIPDLFQQQNIQGNRRRRSNEGQTAEPSFEGVASVKNISGIPVAFLDPSENLVVNLPPVNRKILYVEWSIGTRSGTGDILPKVIVANPNSSRKWP